nr:MAG: hypothetical protein [Bacteriophage sp.]
MWIALSQSSGGHSYRSSRKRRYRKMSKKEWLQEALAVVLGMGAIFAAAAILLLVR